MSVKDTCILYYHGNDFDGVPARQRYLMEALSQYAHIFYLDGSTDKKWRINLRTVSPNLTIIRGLAAALGSFDRHRMKTPARVFASYHLRPLLRPFARVIFWNAENWLRPYRYIAHDELVYDCIDPPFNSDAAAITQYDQLDHEILKAAGTVFATADLLAEQCLKHHQNVHLLNNACEPAEFSAEALAKMAQPKWWPQTPKPIIGFMGSLDWRIDFSLLQSVCAALQEFTFVLAGTRLAPFEKPVKALEALPNVIIPGRLSLDDGRYLLHHMAIGLIPYRPSSMNDCINPVKLYAHALLGKPTAGTAIRELLSRPNAALTGSSAPEMIAAIRRAVILASDETYCAALQQLARENTWKERAAAAAKVLSILPDTEMPQVCAQICATETIA